MDYINGIWQVVLLFLVNCKLCGCYGIACAGRIIVESNVVRLGTNLTVQCQSDTVQCGRLFAIDFNEETIFKKINCSFVKTEIVINNPKSWVYCKVKEYETWRTVCGQDLTAGYPPAKPTKFNCVTHRHSVYVNCSMATTETHLSTKYTITFEHKWTSQSLQYEMKNGHVSIPRSVFNDTLTYDVHVMGRNALGEANSTFTFSVFNIVIPSTPEITKVEFKNGSFSPTIHWKSSDDSLKPSIRFRSVHNNQDWVLGKVTELKDGPILMQQSLEPFKSYELEMRVCLNSTNCSMWSYPFNITCPGKAPSHKLDVWRIIKKNDAHGLQDVAVLWKPYESEDYRGDLLQYKLSYKENGKVQEVNCTAHVTHHTLRLPLDVTEINVSAVTSTGSSPSAPVSLTYTGKPAPIITYLGGAPGGSVRLDWDLSRYREDVKRIMGFVVQWQQSPVHLQWKRIAKDCNYTFLEGMQAGILYNISLYIEEASGLSDPAFGQVYSKEEKPLTGPNVSILYSVGEKHFLIRWEELEQEKRRGFITKYTIYFQRLADKTLIQNSTLPYTLPRSLNWKPQDPQESFSVLVSAWNSAGEGPKGKAATCYSDRRMTCGKIVSDYTTDRMVAGFCLVAAVPIVILANLMFLKCVRQRMVKMCMSMGVTWLFENLPKFDNSNAIQLLKDESYLSWEPLPGDSDPPLTPIEEVNPSWERQDSYPTVIHEDVPETPVVRQSCIECPYKPQRTEGAYETTEEEVKEDEDQFPLLISPLHLPYDFSWDLSTICMQTGRLNSILPMDGSLGSLSVLESFISTPQTASENDGVKENERNVETRIIERSSFISQTVIPNDLESCLLNSSPYSPQGGCFHFSMPEED